jgi:Tfp pilus assembly protein PilN
MENTLSEQEKQYIEYWEKNRLREKKVLNQLLVGLPLGVIFASPVLLNLFGRWYTRADMEAHTKLNPAVLLIAMLLIIVFVAIFSRRHKWEMKEQQYRAFIAKRDALPPGPQENKDEIENIPAANRED